MSKALDDLHEETGDVETALKDYETRKKMAHIGVSIFIGESPHDCTSDTRIEMEYLVLLF